MPKDKQSSSSRFRSLISEFSENVFSAENKTFFCKLCEVKVNPERRSSVMQHVKTEKHRHVMERQQNKKKAANNC